MTFCLDFSIRRATIQDAPEITRLEKSLDVEKDRNNGKRGFTRATFSEADYVKAALQAECFLVGESGQKIAGFIILSSLKIAKAIEGATLGILEAEKRAPKSLFVIQTAIAKKFQRKGIATKLYDCALNKTRAKHTHTPLPS